MAHSLKRVAAVRLAFGNELPKGNGNGRLLLLWRTQALTAVHTVAGSIPFQSRWHDATRDPDAFERRSGPSVEPPAFGRCVKRTTVPLEVLLRMGEANPTQRRTRRQRKADPAARRRGELRVALCLA